MPLGAMRALLTNQQRILAASAVALALAGLGAIAVIDPGTDRPTRPPDSCDVLRSDAVGRALGASPGRVVAVPRPPDPEGDRCNYEDKDTRKLVFFVRVEESKDRAQSLQLAQSLTGTPVQGGGGGGPVRPDSHPLPDDGLRRPTLGVHDQRGYSRSPGRHGSPGTPGHRPGRPSTPQVAGSDPMCCLSSRSDGVGWSDPTENAPLWRMFLGRESARVALWRAIEASPRRRKGSQRCRSGR